MKVLLNSDFGNTELYKCHMKSQPIQLQLIAALANEPMSKAAEFSSVAVIFQVIEILPRMELEAVSFSVLRKGVGRRRRRRD